MADLHVDVAAALRGRPAVGTSEQALTLVTVDDDGQPRAMLLSRAEVDVIDPAVLGAVLRPSTSRANLQRTGRATLLLAHGTAHHSVALRLAEVVVDGDLLGVALDVVAGKADSLGIPLAPLSYVPTPALVALEHWSHATAVLDQVQDAVASR